MGVQTDETPADPVLELNKSVEQYQDNYYPSPQRVQDVKLYKQSTQFSDVRSTNSYATSHQEDQFDY
jgi:hypothetical protein